MQLLWAWQMVLWRVWNLFMNNRLRIWSFAFFCWCWCGCRWRFFRGLFRINTMKYFLYRYFGEPCHPSQHNVTHPVWNRCMRRVVKIAPQDKTRGNQSQCHLREIKRLFGSGSISRIKVKTSSNDCNYGIKNNQLHVSGTSGLDSKNWILLTALLLVEKKWLFSQLGSTQ